jgi:hypothetical protein
MENNELILRKQFAQNHLNSYVTHIYELKGNDRSISTKIVYPESTIFSIDIIVKKNKTFVKIDMNNSINIDKFLLEVELFKKYHEQYTNTIVKIIEKQFNGNSN